jgi:hypothetical protein
MDELSARTDEARLEEISTTTRRERQRPSRLVLIFGGLLLALAMVCACGAAASGVVAALEYGSVPATASHTQTFAVAGTPTLIVQSDAADVNVTVGSANQVTVAWSATIRSIAHSFAQQALDQISVTESQTGNTIRVSIKVPPFKWPPAYLNRGLDFNVSVPAAANLALTTSAGDMSATGISGVFNLQTSAGSVTVDSGTMDSGSSIRSDAGDVQLSQVNLLGIIGIHTNVGAVTGSPVALTGGGDVTIGSNVGDVRLTLPHDTSAHVSATTDIGDVTISGWQILVTRTGVGAAASGDLSPQPSGTLSINTNTGSIDLTAF